MIATDYLVIGSGIAGLTFAVKMAEKCKDQSVVIVTKGNEEESNTKYAQGGVAAVRDFKIDSFQKHIQDTLIAGDGLCDENVVDMVVRQGPKRLNELMQWGANFDLDRSGNLDLGREGGHSEHRIVHHKDLTGYEIETALLRRMHQLPNITMLNHHFAIDLVTEHQLGIPPAEALRCYGAYILDQKTGKIHTIQAGITLLATGGIGRVYGHTTNPEIATGDGIAMAYRAKARIKDMEFVQFHPTVFYDHKEGQSFLISEAVRGFGAYLRNSEGQRFMLDYDPRGELASRDIVSKSIDNELKKSGEPCVFLDATHMDMIAFKKHFPSIYKECAKRNILVAKDWIPVVPASHYLCGGIMVDTHGRTSIRHLFAGGECARTGLHGANRLASNSLLEALVYAHNSCKYILAASENSPKIRIPEWNDQGTVIAKERILIKHNTRALQALMQDYVGIVRSNQRLSIAFTKLEVIYKEVEALYKASKVDTSLCELRNMVNVSYLIIAQSRERKENRGGFYNVDHEPRLL
ncbi:L-aspartate oxidase [Arenibacter sp. GZD96]|uniref:L-aspartate oxidase n=1 Tax=Aurantibrevibacter litoralis TaxID=3106030 RepID=UPI002AFDEE92|nr:L-aspartate oxidase [Arenibacter sp. GZD-96]MEA1784791.1 L-aspartate oxidase [Arenibacter sp. GZD-96]